MKHLATLRKKDDKSFSKKYFIDIINLEEVNKLLNTYISTHNKIFGFSFINCEFVIEFDNNLMANITTKYFYNTDINNINRYLLYDIDCFKSRGYKIYNISQVTIKIISHRCKMTYGYYINQPISMWERKITKIIARNPHLINSLDRYENHPLIRKFLLIPIDN